MSLEVAAAMEGAEKVVENGKCDKKEENLKVKENGEEKVFFEFKEVDNKEMEIEMEFFENGDCDENFEGNDRER